MNFKEAVEIVLEHEGGLVDHSSDPGGVTNYGISQRAYPKLDIRHLTKEKAEKIYQVDYWEANGIETLPEQLRLMVFDSCVNMGPMQAFQILQRCVGAREDGLLGPETLRKVLNSKAELTLEKFVIERINFYGRLPTFDHFGRGWVRRAIDIYNKSKSRV